MTELAGKVVLVTGASRGIGAATATQLGRIGARVVLVARTEHPGTRRLSGSLADTYAGIEATGGQAAVVVADLAAENFDGVDVIRAAEQAFGPVDALVNNAGIAYPSALMKTSTVEWERSFRVNVIAPWALAVAAVASMRERGGGAIVNISSFMAERPGSLAWDWSGPATLGSAYGASKAALNRWTAGLAAEAESWGIVVNAVAPQVVVATEGARLSGQVQQQRAEPMATMVAAIIALCSPATAGGSGRICYSLELVAELGLAVDSLDGSGLLAGWQPGEIPAALLQRRRT